MTRASRWPLLGTVAGLAIVTGLCALAFLVERFAARR